MFHLEELPKEHSEEQLDTNHSRTKWEPKEVGAYSEFSNRLSHLGVKVPAEEDYLDSLSKTQVYQDSWVELLEVSLVSHL